MASGRERLSTFTTSAPASHRRCAARGPAQSAERSTTRGAERTGAYERQPLASSSAIGPAVLLHSKRGVVSLMSDVGGSFSAAMANPIDRPRARSDCASARAMCAAIAASSFVSRSSVTKSAGSISRSAARARFSAIVSSTAPNKRQPPPAEIRAGILNRARIARSPRIVAPSSAVSAGDPLARASLASARSAIEASGIEFPASMVL